MQPTRGAGAWLSTTIGRRAGALPRAARARDPRAILSNVRAPTHPQDTRTMRPCKPLFNCYSGLFLEAKAQLRLVPASGHSQTRGAHRKGEIYMNSAEAMFVCQGRHARHVEEGHDDRRPRAVQLTPAFEGPKRTLRPSGTLLRPGPMTPGLPRALWLRLYRPSPRPCRRPPLFSRSRLGSPVCSWRFS